MKKVFATALTLALVLTAATTSVFAAGHDLGLGAGKGLCDASGANCQYAGAGQDGVCDYLGANCRYTDADQDGVCDYLGANCRYTDADGDGICDHWGTGCGGGQGLGFTDGNGDGVCDNRFSSSRPMDGSGWGHHGGRHG